MGGIEEGEPPLKRVKEGGFLDGSFHAKGKITEPIVLDSSGDSMARTLPLDRDGDTVGSKGVIKRKEFIKIITKALYSLGYDRSGALLEEESGVSLNSPIISVFMQQARDGKWDESVATLHSISFLDESVVKSASFLIFEQKFFELLRVDRVMDALRTLRNEIMPLGFNVSRAHALSACLISPLRGQGDLEARGAKSLSNIVEKLQELLPVEVLVPERRLEYLVEQALDVQRQACVFHNTLDSELSLYSDHQCGRNQIPCQTLQTLQAHSDEVWFLQFSHNGKYLASSSKDHSAIIWEVNENNGQVSLKHRLTGHKKPVLSVCWSPDDAQLLTCGEEEVIRRWDLTSGECLHIYEKADVDMVSCGWFPDGKGVFSGMTDKSICLWDFDGREMECWKGRRTRVISDVAVTDDGKRMISICRDNAILLFDREAKFERLIEEEDTITSFSLSKDDKFLLVNLINQEIHLWSIEGELKVVAKYKGHKRTRLVIRSCFGGFEQAFIASGSEDSQVYIWHRGTGELLLALPGHSGAVNCVSWNPSNPHMLASASDDRTIRIWGLDHISVKCKNATCHSNGRS